MTETDAVEAVKETNIPILIIHGDGDTFVPNAMSAKVHCANPKMVSYHTIAGAEHGISYLFPGELHRCSATYLIQQMFYSIMQAKLQKPNSIFKKAIQLL